MTSALISENLLRICRAIIYTTVRLREARIQNEVAKANSGEVGFEDNDLDFDANLAKFGVSVAHLQAPLEKRKFEAWIEAGLRR